MVSGQIQHPQFLQSLESSALDGIQMIAAEYQILKGTEGNKIVRDKFVQFVVGNVQFFQSWQVFEDPSIQGTKNVVAQLQVSDALPNMTQTAVAKN